MQEGQETLLDCPRHLHHRTETFSEGKGNDDSLRAQINTLCLCEQGAVEGKILVLGEEQLCAESTAAVKGRTENKGYRAKVQGHGTYLRVSFNQSNRDPIPPPRVEIWNNT